MENIGSVVIGLGILMTLLLATLIYSEIDMGRHKKKLPPLSWKSINFLAIGVVLALAFLLVIVLVWGAAGMVAYVFVITLLAISGMLILNEHNKTAFWFSLAAMLMSVSMTYLPARTLIAQALGEGFSAQTPDYAVGVINIIISNGTWIWIIVSSLFALVTGFAAAGYFDDRETKGDKK